MEQVVDGVHRLGSSGHNFYLIIESREATLVDAGCSRDWSQLASGLDSLQLSLKALSAVVATHAHSDHFGLAKRAADQAIDIRVHNDEEARATGKYRGRFSASTKDLPLWNPRAVWNFLPMLRAGVMHLDFLDQVGTFGDGERLDVPGRPTVIHTPGHTEGHSMFLLEDKGVLLTGDGLITTQLLGSHKGPQMIEAVFNLDDSQARQSLDRIVGIEADVLLPGHGDPWFGSPTEAVAVARST